MNEPNKEKPAANVYHLANWYFGTFCALRYGHGRECYDALHKIADSLPVREMTHKEFVVIARSRMTCKPIKRKIHKCPICEKFGVPHPRF